MLPSYCSYCSCQFQGDCEMLPPLIWANADLQVTCIKAPGDMSSRRLHSIVQYCGLALQVKADGRCIREMFVLKSVLPDEEIDGRYELLKVDCLHQPFVPHAMLASMLAELVDWLSCLVTQGHAWLWPGSRPT